MTTRTRAQHALARLEAVVALAGAAAGRDTVRFLALLRELHETHGRRSARPAATLAGKGLAGEVLARRAAGVLRDPHFLRNARALVRKAISGARIIGGTAVKAGEFPDCVAVGNAREWGCTGTLVSPRAVLTAGHCSTCATRVFFGNDVDKPGRIVAVRRRYRHPDYDADRPNDLLVLVLAADVEGVAPRALAPTALVDRARDARVVGFGCTDADGVRGYGRKRQADVPIASASCRFPRGDDSAEEYECEPGYELVAGRELLGRDTCSGDSGGPLLVADARGKWLLAGVTSRSVACSVDACGDGGVYTRVDRYREWIASVPGVALA